MQGTHLTADLQQCACDAVWLTDAARLGERCVLAVQAVGLQPVARLFHSFGGADGGEGAPSGVTATVLLAESHLCLHTWPELQAVSLDVYVCNVGGDHSAQARALMDALVALFEPGSQRRQDLRRG